MPFFKPIEIKIYTMKEVSELLKVTERTLYNYIKGGKFKAKKIGGKWIITEENLKLFIDSE